MENLNSLRTVLFKADPGPIFSFVRQVDGPVHILDMGNWGNIKYETKDHQGSDSKDFERYISYHVTTRRSDRK